MRALVLPYTYLHTHQVHLTCSCFLYELLNSSSGSAFVVGLLPAHQSSFIDSLDQWHALHCQTLLLHSNGEQAASASCRLHYVHIYICIEVLRIQFVLKLTYFVKTSVIMILDIPLTVLLFRLQITLVGDARWCI